MPHSYQSTKNALLSGEICLHYQPIHDLATGNLLGYEALARWGTMPPPLIAEIVEEHSLELTWVREQLCQIDLVLAEVYPPIWVSLNINQRTLGVAQLPMLLATSPHEIGIHLEILESVKLSTATVKAINSIANRHILKADDIGNVEYGWIDRLVGDYSRFFHGLKLCRGLTQNILTDTRTASACKLFITFARECQLETIAEWVESQPQADLLLSWGCTAGQGSLFGMPAPWEYWRQQNTPAAGPGP